MINKSCQDEKMQYRSRNQTSQLDFSFAVKFMFFMTKSGSKITDSTNFFLDKVTIKRLKTWATQIWTSLI